jgi:hypothetical protein
MQSYRGEPAVTDERTVRRLPSGPRVQATIKKFTAEHTEITEMNQ